MGGVFAAPSKEVEESLSIESPPVVAAKRVFSPATEPKSLIQVPRDPAGSKVSSTSSSSSGSGSRAAEKNPLLASRPACTKGQQQREARRLEKAVRTVTSMLEAELRWGFRETHLMIVGLNYPASIATGLSYDEQLEHPLVAYNPVYWGSIALTLPCVVSGRLIHAAVGQGGPVRDDEMEIEREARIQYIYTTDGPFALSALLTAVYSLWLLLSGHVGENVDTAGVAVDFSIDLCYVCGNYLFLDAMRHRRVAEVRMCIFCSGSFVIGLAVLLVSGILNADIEASWSWSRRATWLLRTLCVVFFALAAFIYSRLWNAYNGQCEKINPTC